MTNAKKMDKEKEEMIRIVAENEYDACDDDAEWIVDALMAEGYGNIKQAVKGFADELKELFKAKHAAVMANVACNRIDELLKERYGEE